MAELIHLHSSLVKHFALAQDLALANKQLLSQDELKQWLEAHAQLSKLKQESRKIVFDYMIWRQKINNHAKNRGYLAMNTMIISHIIALAILWNRNLKQETDAILKIGYKLAEKILNRSTEVSEQHFFSLTNKLSGYFKASIEIPAQRFSQDDINFLENKYFPATSLLTISHHVKDPQIDIVINQKVHKISLAGIKLDKIARQVSQYLKN